MEKIPVKKQEIEYDPLVPVSGLSKANHSSSCFGKGWDLSDNNCHLCADRDVCGILTKSKLEEQAKQLEKEVMKGGKFLDQADLSVLTKEWASSVIVSGETEIKSLVEKAQLVSKCYDEVAIIEWLKRIKSELGFKVKGGVIWL